MFRFVQPFSTISRARNLPASLTEALARGAPIDLHPEVEDALATRKPIVALETAIVTHGMPHPVNLDTARSVEANIRKSGAIPATIGLIDGRVHIGLSNRQLERLATPQAGAVKVSRRDIAAALALKKDGGTTCSSTLIFAALSGIKVAALFFIYTLHSLTSSIHEPVLCHGRVCLCITKHRPTSLIYVALQLGWCTSRC
jgi:pseudouridylate synthase / pseudouridine kinase